MKHIYPVLFLCSLLVLIAPLRIAAMEAKDEFIYQLSSATRLTAVERISTFDFRSLEFTVTQLSYADSMVVSYSAESLDLTVSYVRQPAIGTNTWTVTGRAAFHREIYLTQLNLQLCEDQTANHTLLGIRAIQSGNEQDNKPVYPYTDKAAQYNLSYGTCWIVASNYRDCQGVEGLTPSTIKLYDNGLHKANRYNPNSALSGLPMDALYRKQDSVMQWSWLVFTEKPLLISINRWLGDSKAALCITNDADGENGNRLKAFYYGSNQADNPKYLTEGAIANRIPISNTIFGINQATLGDVWDSIQAEGNSIGYHTYDPAADPSGININALLNDLSQYNIRLWIDHSVPQNPEDLAWNGLDPTSPNYVGDAINNSNIDYVWLADTPPNNPFNAFDEPWRLPHLQYEASCFTKPVWFFGRTREEVWQYLNSASQVDMRNIITPENLDKLIIANGLHVSYTHFSSAWAGIVPFHQITDTGDYEIRPEVENMLRLLAYYRDHRGLWIDTVENVFDRMLAIEKVVVQSVVHNPASGQYIIRVENLSDHDLRALQFSHEKQSFIIPLLAAHTTAEISFYSSENHASVPVVQEVSAVYREGNLLIEIKSNSSTVGVKLEVYNIKGQLISKHYFSDAETKVIPFGAYSSGVYLLRLSNNNTHYMQKLVVVK